jgi:hypothetical protein
MSAVFVAWLCLCLASAFAQESRATEQTPTDPKNPETSSSAPQQNAASKGGVSVQEGTTHVRKEDGWNLDNPTVVAVVFDDNGNYVSGLQKVV